MHDIIVIGASAGGVEAVVSLVGQLPAGLPAAIFVVIHFPPQATSVLPYLLNRAGKLEAHHASDGEKIQHGHIYVALPDWHLLLHTDHVQITRGPQENRHRPAIDPLFRSAALHHGGRVVGVLLSGMLDDGTAGMQAIKARGGVTICQDPTEAIYPPMPRNAIEQVGVDHVLPLRQIATLLVELNRTTDRATGSAALVQQLQQETEIAALNWNALGVKAPPGTSSTYGCPGCGGVLWEVQDEQVWRYRCRVGHAYSAQELLASQENQLEAALWTALRALEERGSLLERMATRAEAAERPHASHLLDLQKLEVEERAALLRTVLSSGGLAALAEAGSQLPPDRPDGTGLGIETPPHEAF
jgi:two-component system chemotaxis response regulator CheB